MNKRFPKFGVHLVRREAAEGYMLLTLVSFATSVTVTRLFLSLTGYPQIGKGELHIAHVLWGGLLLYVGALIPLLFSNKGVYTFASILTGIGIGLFIDEVGKFITQSNNYFFPLAAPIIYVFFLLSIMALLHIRSTIYKDRYTWINQAMEKVGESMNKPPNRERWEKMSSDLKRHLTELEEGPQADLARAFLVYAETVEPALPTTTRKQPTVLVKFSQKVAGLITARRIKNLLIIGLIFMGLLMWKNPISVVSKTWFGGRFSLFLNNLHLGGQIVTTGVTGWTDARLALEVLLGTTLLVAGILMTTKKSRFGVIIGIFGLILSLTTVDLLLFYFEQFSTIITTLIQFALLAGLLYYRDRLKG